MLKRLNIAILLGFVCAANADETVDARIARVIARILPRHIVEGTQQETPSLESRMSDLHVPGLSVAVIHDGKIDWARGFGVTQAGGIPITPDTLFQAASLSKPITALAVLELVDAGKLDLDENANMYLRRWRIPENDFTRQHAVTLRELLNHSAGISMDGFTGYDAGTPLPTLVQTLDGIPPANHPPIRVEAVPNSTWNYSGGGYVILRQILEDVTGQPFASLLGARVLDPVGMVHSNFEQPLSPQKTALAATPYVRNGHSLSGGAKVYPELAPDGLWTTPSDIARYIMQVQQSLAGQPGGLLMPATAKVMLAPGLQSWGLGPVVGDGKELWFSHSGANHGFLSLFVGYAAGDGAVIMSNSDNSFELQVDLLRTIAHEYHWPAFAPKVYTLAAVGQRKLDGYVGAYRVANGGLVFITRDSDKLILQTQSGGPRTLYPLSNDTFLDSDAVLNTEFVRFDDRQLTFRSVLNGQAKKVEVKAGEPGNVLVAKRTSNAERLKIARQLEALNRRYRHQAPAAGAEALVKDLLPKLASGRTDYLKVTHEFKQTLKGVVGLNRQVFTKLGSLRTISFLKTDATGRDTYTLTFAHGRGEMDVTLSETGYIQDAAYLPE